MKSWILSICAVVMITAIITLILPTSKIGKYIKSIFSLFIVFTIIKPIFYIKENDFKYEDKLIQNDIEFQYEFMEFVNRRKIEEYEIKCVEILEKCGVNNSYVEIVYTLDFDLQIKIEQVKVNLKNSVIISDKEHINIIKEVRQNIAGCLNIKEELVSIYE